MKRIFALCVVCLILFVSPALSEPTQELTLDDSGTISLVGSGVSICDPITISEVPARVTYTQSDGTEYDLSYIYGDKNHTLLDGYTDYNGVSFIDKSGEYTFLVESKSDWTIQIDPLKEAEFSALSGSGDCVTDIYTFDKPVIIQLNAKFNGYDNLFLYAYIETKYGWDKNYLANELEDAGFNGEYKYILKIPTESRVFFELDFDDGEWSLDIL